MLKKLIYNVRLAGEERADAWLLMVGQYIHELGYGENRPDFDYQWDGKGALILPGVIDCHVHFREPGLIHKADIGTESRAAAIGGVTSFLDMPNTKPATVTLKDWEEKCELAHEKSMVNYGFFIGATNDNIEQLRNADYTRIPGVKLFMGSSTGNMLVDNDQMIDRLFAEVDAIVAVHAEDQAIIEENAAQARQQYPDGNVPVALHSQIRSIEACYKCTERAVKLAKAHNHHLHICHLTTARELGLLQSGPLAEKLITSEVSPHHLLWCDEDYATQGSRIKMNPAVKSAADRDALLEALRTGLIDMVATDHAPHLLSEKEGDAFTAVSGAPMVQFSLLAMLGLVDETTVQRTMCLNPALIYKIKDRGRLAPGYYADIVLVDSTEPYTVTDEMVISRCGWTPMAGRTLRHRVQATWVNGVLTYANDQFVNLIPGKPLMFGL